MNFPNFKLFQPDFDTECYVCGTSPCVVVSGHVCPHTELCGPCFFQDRAMVDWEEWNDYQEDTE